jgi:photosystem II stability/assembly factor-like uncharacterized protein
MKNFSSIIVVIFLLLSCSADKAIISNPKYTKVTIDTLLNETLSSRAIIIDQNKVWYAANNGNYGYVTTDESTNFKGNIAKENLKLEFRSIAQTSKYIFILSVSNPALLYRIAKDNSEIKLVYQEKHDKVFYDSMQFLNDDEGFAIGDPTENCPSLIQTTNGGETWSKIPCSNLPKFADGEAFFATSNTNLIVKDDTIWLASGGKKSRVYRSQDKGNTWEIFETPIVQGEAMTGIFTADFYDENIGFITGGNYEKQNQNFSNKAITKDGGATWKLIDDNKAFGYASCVQFLPNSGGKSLVVIANSGIYYYRQRDKKWKQLSSEKDLYTLRFIDNKTAIAAGKNKIVKLTFKN